MKKLEYKVTDLPPIWPGKKTTYRKPAPFKTAWSKTEHLLARELAYLGARQVEMALEIRGAIDLRQDGMLLATARPGPAVIVSFIDRDGQRQAYPCDRFAWWQDNLYAIAVVLEDLRRAERYGVQSALIRAGFKALPQPGQSTVTITAADAASVIASFSDAMAHQILTDPGVARAAIRVAVSRTHPDRHAGDRKYFDGVAESKKALEKHFGAAL